MKNKKSFPIVSLVMVLTATLAACRIIRTCVPFGVLPPLNIPNMVLICGLALLLDHLRSGKTTAADFSLPVLAAFAFGLLPWAAGFAQVNDILKLGITGGVVFGLTAWVYDSMADRLATGSSAKAAPVLSVFGLYLAAQCFAGMIL